jgi:glycosyltransferase involved in cell wall biosynthesis
MNQNNVVETGFFKLDSIYSTTQRVTRTQPVILNKPEDKIEPVLFFPELHIHKTEGGLRTRSYFKNSHYNKPLISIITVVYNGSNHIEQTINSVLDQTYDNVEYIIVDGNSTDGTLDIIKKYDEVIDYWISENDEGIADAMNKGVSLSTGEYIIYINADDYLFDNSSLSNALLTIGGCDLLMCKIVYGGQDSRQTLSPRGFNFWFFFKSGILHQGAITHRNVFNLIGDFDTQFRIALDYDFFLRAHIAGVKAKKSDVILSFMRDTGVSSKLDRESLVVRLKEEQRVQNKNNKSFLRKVFYKIYWILYPIYKLPFASKK